MNLYTVLILAKIFAENNVKVNAHSKVDQDPIKNRLHKTAAELAKLIHLVSGYVDTEDSGLETDEELTKEDRVDTSSDTQPFDLDYFIVRTNQPNVQDKTMAPKDYYDKQKDYLGSRARLNQVIGTLQARPRVKPHNKSPGGPQGTTIRPQKKNLLWKSLKKSAAWSKAKQNIPWSRPQQPGQWGKPHQNDHRQKPKQFSDPGTRPNQANPARMRLHMLKNPKVLEMFKKKLKNTKFRQYAKENGDASNDYQDSNQRRNAVFRFDTASIEDSRTSKPKDKGRLKTKRISKSLEDFKEKNFDGDKDISLKYMKKHDVDIFINDDKRKKGRNDDSLKQDNAWDVITKKYDWNDQHSSEDKPKNKNASLKKFKKPKFDDDWDKKVTKQDFDDWPKKDKRDKNNKWDSVEIKPKKKKESIKWDSVETNSNKKKDFDDFEKPQKERKKKKNDWDNVTVFKITAPKTTKKWKKVSSDDWEKPYAHKIVPYHNSRVKKSRDGFDSSGVFGRTPIPYVGRQGIYVDNDN